MLPDMADVLTDWEQDVTIKTVAASTVDFEKTETVTSRTQRCVIQVADKDKLNADTIDWSLDYIMVHSKQPIANGEFIQYKGREYKVIGRGHWDDYGYTEVIGEQTKRPIK